MIRDWWQYLRRCSCSHQRKHHTHYRAGTDCSYRANNDCDVCPCERFQWRLLKWVY